MPMQEPSIAIIKVGTGVLANGDGVGLDSFALDHLVDQLAEVMNSHFIRPVIVSSGAVAAGRGVLKRHRITLGKDWPKPGDETPRQQRLLAGIGQPDLIAGWKDSLTNYHWGCAQYLLTSRDFGLLGYRRDIKSTLIDYLVGGVVPIINENDLLSPEELEGGSQGFSDNDQLAFLIARLVKAESLVFLSSDVDGYYDGDPGDGGKLVKTLTGNEQCTASVSRYGRGGPANKLRYMHMAMDLGINTYWANSRKSNVITDILLDDQNPGTFGPGRQR